jgi:hypothetical protein
MALAKALHGAPCRTATHVHAVSKGGQVWVRGLELMDSLQSVLLDPCVGDAMCVAAIAGIGGNAPRGSLPDWTPRPCCVKKRTGGFGFEARPAPPRGGGAKMPTRRTGSGSKPFTQKIGEVLGNCQNCKVLCQEIWIRNACAVDPVACCIWEPRARIGVGADRQFRIWRALRFLVRMRFGSNHVPTSRIVCRTASKQRTIYR